MKEETKAAAIAALKQAGRGEAAQTVEVIPAEIMLTISLDASKNSSLVTVVKDPIGVPPRNLILGGTPSM